MCNKYGGDETVAKMINEAFDKLIDRGHIVLLKDLDKELQDKILNAKTGYFIPYDVAFKEGSLSTPARPVFDASSRTPGGESLNNLLAKGSPDFAKLIHLHLDWRMGPSALIGDIRQFYNTLKILWQCCLPNAALQDQTFSIRGKRVRI